MRAAAAEEHAIADHPPTQQGAVPPRPSAIDDNLGMRMLLPVGRTGWSIVAGYLGLFSILIAPAPIALIVGIIAIVHIARAPDRRRGLGRSIFAVAMGLAFTTIGVLGLLSF